MQRKSCLKRSSFELPNIQITTSDGINSTQASHGSSSSKVPVRRSKFDALSKMSIDGPVLRHDPSSDRIKENDQENQSVDSDEDNGSSHNIYGSQQFVLSKEIRENFGLD